MKWKHIYMVGLVASVVFSLAACGGKTTVESTSDSNSGDRLSTEVDGKTDEKTEADSQDIEYNDIKLGETGKDIKTTLKILDNRTDMLKDDYTGTPWKTYVENFNKIYPDIIIEIEGVTNYAQDSLLRLQGGDWGDIMMIPEVDKSDLSTYFLSYGSREDVAKEANYVTKWMFDDQIYGIPSTAVGRGIVYNKKVFEAAGITALPKNPDEFIADLQAIKEKTDAIPLYTNYAAGWTMGAWDDYISGTATGDKDYMNRELLHTKDPFSDPGDGTHAYNVYKILYDAAQKKLIEDDYSTTDWEGSKGMLNRGEIGCMVLGSWAYSQMQQAGPNPDDIGYMPFPMNVGGKQYSAAAPDYNFGINAKTDKKNQEAALIFVKWMTEESGFSYNEGGLPIKAGDNNLPEVYKSFDDNHVEFVEDEPAFKGEEDLLNNLNADSELMVTAGGNEKIQSLIEEAANGGKGFSEIMDEWNKKWSDAQTENNVSLE